MASTNTRMSRNCEPIRPPGGETGPIPRPTLMGRVFTAKGLGPPNREIALTALITA